MPRFHFRLATLLKVREAARDERRGHLAEALRALAIVRDRQRDTAAELDELIERSRQSARPGRLELDALHQASRFALVLRTQLQELARQIQQVEQEAEKRRAALVEADREVRVLEKLRERQLEEWQTEEARQEGKRLDEAGVVRAARGGNHGWAS